MIQPNFDTMLWAILILWVLGALAKIVVGLLQMEKASKYDGGDVVSGFLQLAIIAYILFK